MGISVETGQSQRRDCGFRQRRRRRILMSYHFWRGHIVNSLNGIFKHHMQEFVDILTNGILIEIGTVLQMLNVYVHILKVIYSLFHYNYF